MNKVFLKFKIVILPAYCLKFSFKFVNFLGFIQENKRGCFGEHSVHWYQFNLIFLAEQLGCEVIRNRFTMQSVQIHDW